MEMFFILFCLVLLKLNSSYGCSMENVNNWLLPVTIDIYDIERDVFFRRSTSNIEGVNLVTNSEGLNGGPYLTVSYNDSEFTIIPNDQFENYEENETENSIGVTVSFRCTGGSSNTLVFIINIKDTNNNAPQFRPSDHYHYKVAPPLPPGFLISDCINNLIVRDIDLTTQRIDFEIEENSFFEIVADTPTTPKEFKATLRTTAFIRRISEPIVLWIKATDVDLTDDPPITTNATVRIEADTEFEFPDDLIFSQTFYIATYTNEGNILMESDIYLQQGYDESVNFTLEGDNKDIFNIDVDENRITLRAITQLPTDLLTDQIYFILKANREHTSGATATIIVNLPKGPNFMFEEAYYKGSIIDNSLNIPSLVLQESSDFPEIQIVIYKEFSQYFSGSVQNNNIILRMNPLHDEILQNNNILTLQVVAIANNRTAATVVVLEIIKNDLTTPIFEKNIYNGTYDPIYGVTVENITLIQGFDESVTVSLEGDFENYFQITRAGNVFNIVTSGLPPHVLTEQRLLLSIIATKPRTVGAQAVLYIAMPEARALAFKYLTYSGFLINNSVILETIDLNVGYDDDVTFELTGDYASYFPYTNDGNQVTLRISDQIPESVIFDNNIVILTLTAEGNNTEIARTTIILEIIKQDTRTPMFNKNIYHGNYLDTTINIENIFLTQGFDDNVTFHITGENAQYFAISYTGSNNISIYLENIIPEELIFKEKVLLFNILAEKPFSVSANAAISVNFPRELIEPSVMRFSKNSYIGNITNEIFTVETILLDEGFQPQTEFLLSGDLASLFNVTNDGNIVTVQSNEQLSEEVIENNNFIVLYIEAIHPRTIKAHATIVVEIIRQLEPVVIPPIFERTYYYGTYSVEDELQFNQTIRLKEGFTENISFELVGDNSVWFTLTPLDIGVVLTLQSPIPSEVLAENQQLIFIVTANLLNTTVTAESTIVVGLINDVDEIVVLEFNKLNFIGTIDNNTLTLEPISLVQGFSSDVVFTLQGELASYFYIALNASTVTFQLESTIPDNIVPNNRIIILELVATAPQAVPAYVTIVIEFMRDEIPSNIDILKFTEAYYIGAYNETGLDFNHNIKLAEGYDETVEFTLVGENSIWFGVIPAESGVTISLASPIPVDVLNNNRPLIFEISASKPSSSLTARSAIIITITTEANSTQILGFEKNSYLGTVDNITVNLEPITLVKGFTSEVQFLLNGEMANLFTKRIDGAIVNILLGETMPDEILSENRVIILELEAVAPEAPPTYTTIVLEVVQRNQLPVQVLKFKETYYTGQYKDNDVLEFEQAIALTNESLDGVEYSLQGDNAIWFSLQEVEEGLLVILSTPIPQNVQSENMLLVFIIIATKPESIAARSTIVISLPNASEDNNTYFDKLLYRGVIRDDIVTHENIFVSGYNGSDVEIFGEHETSFVVQINQGLVTIGLRDSTTVTVDNSYVILEIRVPGAGCVLQLDNIKQEIPALPTIRFSSESYVIEVDLSQTGLIGQVSATADNGESITYSLSIDNDELKERLSINSNGELHLSTAVRSGVFTFRVVASTDITQVNGTATVVLVVESGEEIVLPPLIIIERDEESPYNNLVTLNTTFQDCRYEMTNRWPIDQSWLYVDDNGLHTNAIDREHESVAFMALSQIQVELNLQCDTDELIVRSKASFNNIPMTASLGPYDYGTYKWVLTDPILYDPRRSFVNLIVNDINDNDPIFVLKDNEPIAVGYPLPELEEIVPPRALVELTATDADIEENAALVYWSSEPALAVSPTTGRVHVSNSSLLQHEALLRVSATDRNGVDGRTGHIDLLIRLLDFHQIAVLTVQGAFLEDENIVLTNLTNALGYEVKALRSVILPMDSDTNENTSRMERATHGNGALLQLYIYGLINREPVEVSQLTSDINNIVMGNIARTVSLEDHLESREICSLPARDTGLLAATIALSILLFIIIVASAVWFFLKWRKTYNYNNFSDQNSLASRDQTPPTLKIEEAAKPRMNIDELKRSERRLQDILDAPETSTQKADEPETVVDVPTPEQRVPIVIQSIDKLKDAAETSDDEDEFGETQKARRKSVVTFNENVEKIIHLEDTPSDADYEVYKF